MRALRHHVLHARRIDVGEHGCEVRRSGLCVLLTREVRQLIENFRTPCGKSIENVERIVEVFGGFADAFSSGGNKNFMKHVLTRPRNLKAPRACERIAFQWKRPGFIEKNIDILKSLGVDGTNNFHRALGRTSFGEEFYFGLLDRKSVV